MLLVQPKTQWAMLPAQLKMLLAMPQVQLKMLLATLLVPLAMQPKTLSAKLQTQPKTLLANNFSGSSKPAKAVCTQVWTAFFVVALADRIATLNRR